MGGYSVFPVYESFKDYITVESLEGDNKYDAGVHGMQVSSIWYLSSKCKFQY